MQGMPPASKQAGPRRPLNSDKERLKKGYWRKNSVGSITAAPGGAPVTGIGGVVSDRYYSATNRVRLSLYDDALRSRKLLTYLLKYIYTFVAQHRLSALARLPAANKQANKKARGSFFPRTEFLWLPCLWLILGVITITLAAHSSYQVSRAIY